MVKTSFDEIPPFSPLSFFSVRDTILHGKEIPSNPLKRKKYLVEPTTEVTGQGKNSSLYMAWHSSGLTIEVESKKEFQESHYPRFVSGDAVEIFIDTRDMKNAGFITRFCHHFLFLPRPANDVQKTEITRFRTDDTHDLAPDEELQLTVDKKKMAIFIPSHCLHEYDPDNFDRIGFSYRIHQYRGDVQDFAPDVTHYPCDQQPALWPSFSLIKGT